MLTMQRGWFQFSIYWVLCHNSFRASLDTGKMCKYWNFGPRNGIIEHFEHMVSSSSVGTAKLRAHRTAVPTGVELPSTPSS